MKINEIIIKKRIRQDLGDLTPLKESLQKHGLLYPIIINSKNELIAGERRLSAAKELGWTEIDVLVREVTAQDAIELELNENTTRKEFNNVELTKGLNKHAFSKKNFFQKILHFFQHLFSKK